MTKGNLTRPVAAILLTGLALSFGDALVRLGLQSVSVWQLFVMRSVLVLPVLLMLLRRSGIRVMPRNLGLTVLRSVMLVAMWVVYYAALTRIPMATAAAGYYTLPIFIAIFASLVGQGRLGCWGWSGVALGFAGMVLIVRPEPIGFDLALTWPLGAAVLYAAAMVLTRQRLQRESPLVLTVWLNLLFCALGGLGMALTQVHPVDVTTLALIAVMAVAMVTGTLASAYAYQTGPSAVIGTFDYGYLICAILWGWVVFGEVPDGWAWIGMALIVGAGLLVIRRRASET